MQCVISPDLVPWLEAKIGEFHPGPSLGRPSDFGHSVNLALAEGEVKAEVEFGPERDRLLGGEKRSHCPELGDPPFSEGGAW